MAQTAEQTDTNGRGQVDLKSTSTSTSAQVDETTKLVEKTKPVQFRIPAHAIFQAAAKRAGLGFMDAADVAADLFDQATRAEDANQARLRKKAELKAKFGSGS